MEKLVITPKTKIYDLLEAYPELEDELVSMAPEFRKLKNPVLRKTIARVANISQAATIGGLNVEQMVNRFREKVGQTNIEQFEDSNNRYNTACPDWYKKENITNTIDIREMLNRDEQPVHEILSSIRKLGDNELLEIIAPFIPAPLLDKSLSLGYKHWLEKEGEGEFRVLFKK